MLCASDTLQSLNVFTPTEILSQHLISYDRKKDLAPILFAFSTQTRGANGGKTDEFFYADLEAAIKRNILLHKGRVNLVIRQFDFALESERLDNVYAKIRLKVQQDSLPSDVSSRGVV